MSRCGRCGKDPCRCPSWAQVHQGGFLKRVPRGPSRKQKDARRRHLQDQQTAATGRQGRGRGRRRNDEPPEMTAAQVYQLMDWLEGIGVKTHAPTVCPTCGLEALCPHRICLMCNPCSKCGETP